MSMDPRGWIVVAVLTLIVAGFWYKMSESLWQTVGVFVVAFIAIAVIVFFVG